MEGVRYRWVVLGLAWLLFGSLYLFWYDMGTLAPKLMEIYGIDQTTYSLAFTLRG